MRETKTGWLRFALCLGALCLPWSACGSQQDEASPDSDSIPAPFSPPSLILLISVDTLRADHLGCYGHSRPTSPQLDAFAETATLYSTVRSTSPWTLPSHASLFTGLYPFEHGARTFKIEEQDGTTFTEVGKLSEHHRTLAEELKAIGFRTVGFAANVAFLNDRFAISQGFDEFDSEGARCRVMNRRVMQWFAQAPAEPTFLFINYMDTHRPYNNRPMPGFPDLSNQPPSGEVMKKLYRAILGNSGKDSKRLLKLLKDQYDLSIANLDDALGKLFDFLRTLDRFEDALIVVTSDHGEFFGEHQLIEHSKDIYEAVLRIPLIIKFPHQTKGRVVAQPISLARVPQLIYQAAGLTPTPATAAFHVTPTGRPLLVQNYYSRKKDLKATWGQRFNRARSALYWEDYKYIQSSDGAHELFDLKNDPGELQNLMQREPDRAQSMADSLQNLLTAGPVTDPDLPSEPLTPEELKQLEELGYH